MSGLHDYGVRNGTALVLDHPKILHQDFSRIAEARDVEGIEAAMREFVWATGFDRYAVVTIDHDCSRSGDYAAAYAIHNTPTEYAEQWDDRERGKTDPVLQHCKLSGTPLAYGQDTYVKSGMGERWEHQASFGFAFGVAATLHLPHNQHVLFGIDRFEPLPTNRTELTALVAYTQLFATFVQCAVQSVLDTPRSADRRLPGFIRLSPREHECLQRAAEGKTAWET